MALRVPAVVRMFIFGAALLGLAGCQRKPVPPPPKSDAITTEPVNIELPASSQGSEKEEKTAESPKAP